MRRLLDALLPWLLVLVIGAPLALWGYRYLDDARGGEKLEWAAPRAGWLALGAILAGWVLFHLRRARAATMAFTRVGALAQVRRGAVAHLAILPGVLRVLAIVAIAVALARPRTVRTVEVEVDSVDIMIVLDLSKSMEEADLRRNRIDAAQRTIRRFIARRKSDRVGLVVFAQGAMLQCPLTFDHEVLDQIVADLALGDIPEFGTAIGDGLGMALAQLRRSDAKSKIVILLSDGDSNWVTKFEPDEAALVAQKMKVKVFTVLVGAESGVFGDSYSVNPDTLTKIAKVTEGRFFKAGDTRELDSSFEEVRDTLVKTTRKVTGRVPDKELFLPLAVLAAILIALEQGLLLTRFRRFP